MNHKSLHHRFVLGGVLFISAFAGLCRAQEAPSGLDSMDKNKVLRELAARDLKTLLQRAFEVDHVTPQDRQSIEMISMLQRIQDTRNPLGEAERIEMLKKIATGIDAVLPSMDDPNALMPLATNLIRLGAEPDVNKLEYWGKNPKTQASLRPIVEAILRVLDKAQAAATKQAKDWENKIRDPDDAAARNWDKMSGLANTAKFTRTMTVYYLLLAMDRSDAKLQSEANKAIAQLREFDNPEFGIQPVVHNRMAKLNMVQGKYAEAKQQFAQVIDGTKLKPKPDMNQQFEARYFSAVCDVLDKKADAARQGMNDLRVWESGALAKIKNQAVAERTKRGLDAALAMLNYRILSLEAELAKDPGTREKANNAAIDTLLALLKEQPGLQTIIFEMLLGRLPDKPDFAKTDPLILQAIVFKGVQETQKPANSINQAYIKSGIAAARELIGRKGTTVEQLDRALLALPDLLEKSGQLADAAQAWMEFAVKAAKTDRARSSDLMDNALWMLGKIKPNPAYSEDPKTQEVYGKVIDAAVNPPFNRVKLAYDYARYLQRNKDDTKAVKIFGLVPQDDPRLVESYYYQMASMKELLGDKPDEARRQQLLNGIQKRATELERLVNQKIVDATSEQRLRYRSILVNTTLIAAKLALQQQKDYARALKLLEGFEDSVEGMSKADDLKGDALFIRVNALMAQEKYNEATNELLKLLRTGGSKEAQDIVFSLLTKLNDDLDDAQRANDVARMRTLAKNRALLSDFLIQWAKANKNPEVQKNLYIYLRFDASTKAMAADLELDEKEILAAHRKARDLYVALQAPAMVKLFQQRLPAGQSIKDNPYDPIVLLNVGLLSYDIAVMTNNNLDDCKLAQLNLGRLMYDQKLGKPYTPKEKDGQFIMVENLQFWEALYKLFRSNLIVGKSDPKNEATMITPTKAALADVFIVYGDGVGGSKFKLEFAKLRKDLLPDFDPAANKKPTTTAPATAPAATPATAPATQPAGK